MASRNDRDGSVTRGLAREDERALYMRDDRKSSSYEQREGVTRHDRDVRPWFGAEHREMVTADTRDDDGRRSRGSWFDRLLGQTDDDEEVRGRRPAWLGRDRDDDEEVRGRRPAWLGRDRDDDDRARLAGRDRELDEGGRPYGRDREDTRPLGRVRDDTRFGRYRGDDRVPFYAARDRDDDRGFRAARDRDDDVRVPFRAARDRDDERGYRRDVYRDDDTPRAASVDRDRDRHWNVGERRDIGNQPRQRREIDSRSLGEQRDQVLRGERDLYDDDTRGRWRFGDDPRQRPFAWSVDDTDNVRRR